MGIRGQLLSLVLLAGTPSAALFVYNALESREVAVRDVTMRLQSVTRAAAEDLENRIAGAKHMLSVLAEVPAVRRAEQPACSQILGDFARRAPHHTDVSLTVTAHDGAVVCSSSPLSGPVNLANRDYFNDALATRSTSVGKPVISRISSTARLPIAYPVQDPAGNVEKLLTAGINLEAAVAPLIMSPALAGATFTIWDEQGTVLFRHPDNAKWFGTAKPESGIVKVLAASRQMETVEAAGLDGVPRVYALARLDNFPRLGLIISAGIGKEALAAEANRALRNGIALPALFLAALAGAWLFGETAIRRRVAALARAASRIAGGKLETRIGGPYRGGELGQLAYAFDEMAGAMERQIEDIRRGEQELRRVNRMLKSLSECNQALIRARNEPDLLDAICGNIVRIGGYKLAWVGFAEHDEAKTIRPVARAGEGGAYIDELQLNWADTERGRGQTGTAIRTGATVIINDTVTNPVFALWRDVARKHGFAASIALPLMVEGSAIGALTIYSGEANAFDKGEVALLTELADDLAYGLNVLRVRVREAQAQEDLRRLNAELEQRVAERTTQLVQTAKMASLGQLVAGVAHEINNPLAFVINHQATVANAIESVARETGAQLSAAGSLSLDKARQRNADMQMGLERIKDLVLKLRTFSRLDEGELKFVKIDESIESVVTLLQYQLNGRIALIRKYGDPKVVACYPGPLNQVIMNVLSNAIDAIDGKGEVTVTTGKEDSMLFIAVTDTGKGMPAAVRERIFEPFFTTKPVGRGTGLGLSISYGIIQRHKGALEVRSDEGKGTTVVIKIPLDLGGAKAQG